MFQVDKLILSNLIILNIYSLKILAVYLTTVEYVIKVRQFKPHITVDVRKLFMCLFIYFYNVHQY